MSRWQKWFTDEPRFAHVNHSTCVVRSAALFQQHGCRRILDLGSGAGRESRYLQERFPFVASLEFTSSGLALAQEKATRNLLRADARQIPFPDQCFDGVYCYGLLHEFCGPQAPVNVKRVMAEIRRVLKKEGVLILAVLEGDPVNGDPELPDVQLFSDEMYFDALTGFDRCLEYLEYDDTSCTGNGGYHIHYGAFVQSAEERQRISLAT